MLRCQKLVWFIFLNLLVLSVIFCSRAILFLNTFKMWLKSFIIRQWQLKIVQIRVKICSMMSLLFNFTVFFNNWNVRILWMILSMWIFVLAMDSEFSNSALQNVFVRDATIIGFFTWAAPRHAAFLPNLTYYRNFCIFQIIVF